MEEVTEPGASRKQQLTEQFELYLRDEWKAMGARGAGVRWEVAPCATQAKGKVA